MLLAAGGALAVVAVGAWTLDTFSRMPSWVIDAFTAMPAWMLRLAVYKLVLASAAGLMIAGAVLRRELRVLARARAAGAAEADRAIGAGAAPPPMPQQRSADYVVRTPAD